MKKIHFLLFIFLSIQNIPKFSCQCTVDSCYGGCCANNICLNTTDISMCQFDKNYNFDFLINTLIALASFIVGWIIYNDIFLTIFFIFERISTLCYEFPMHAKNFLFLVDLWNHGKLSLLLLLRAEEKEKTGRNRSEVRLQ